MPEPLSPNIGFGMNVTVLPCFRATFLMMYLYHIKLSAIRTSGPNRMSISHWPAVATSWWCISIGTPMPISVSIISDRMSCSVSAGGTGKYPSLCRSL